MGLYTRFVSGLLFPLQERLKRHDTVAVRRALEQSQWWSQDALRALQVQRLRRLLTLVGAHVPHYRELFQALQFDPRAVRSLDDLRCLPRMGKADIRAAGDRLRSEQARGLARFNTGGSSGEPLIFYIGHERVSHDVAAKWRATRWWGVDIGDPEIVVWGSPIEVGSQDRVKALRDALMRTELLPAFEMSPSRLDGFIAAIRRKRPRMLFGYPSALSLIAQHAQQRGERMDDLGIRVAFVTSERLYDEQRATISTVFGCPVANGYGGRDAGFIAHECPAGSLHLTAEDVIVELLDEAGEPVAPGQSGEIVVTHLATPDFPFIRYRTGDMAVQSGRVCACGRGLPVLDEVQGRSTDFVIAQDGTVMHGLALIYILRDLPGVAAFKIVQHSRDRTEVMVVPGEGWRDEHKQTIERGVRARLGAGVQVELQLLDRIPPERSGKFRYIVSHAR
jgi:phenylacetate-CoA ligase